MKRLLIILMAAVVLLSACGSKETLIHDDFRSDLAQVFEVLDLAYEENRNPNEAEEKLLKQFNDKYMLGQFSVDSETYKMSDLEKEITRKIDTIKIFTEHDEPLASETTLYEKLKDEIEEYLTMKEVPEELVDKHPIYEKQREIQPQFIEDTKKMIVNLNPVVNVRDDIYQDEYKKLQGYIKTYGGDGFEVDGTHYLHNEESHDMYMTIWSISYDIDDGALRTYSRDRFLELKEELE